MEDEQPADVEVEPEEVEPEYVDPGEEEVLEEEPAPPAEEVRPVVPESTLGSVVVAEGETMVLPAGVVEVTGDWQVDGKLQGENTTVVFTGNNQTISGRANLRAAILRGGTKRVRGSMSTRGVNNARPGQAAFVVEAGTTVVIEKGASVSANGEYGFQVAGNLVLEGGNFSCSFSNGNGRDNNDAWLPGSTLVIHSGKFSGNGDADFSGATITVHDGELSISDDIWNSGDALYIYGGTVSNDSSGGMFWLTGRVELHGGTLRVRQGGERGLGVVANAVVFATNGELVLECYDATREDSGIRLYSSAQFAKVTANASTTIFGGSDKECSLTIGSLNIAAGKVFDARGRNVSAWLDPEGKGTFKP
ncbi:MAG: hypothetical protein IT463_01245 [Planctomycetes bacterium]|nr:hypothetical protein [Planctomycetota bacterium]